MHLAGVEQETWNNLKLATCRILKRFSREDARPLSPWRRQKWSSRNFNLKSFICACCWPIDPNFASRLSLITDASCITRSNFGMQRMSFNLWCAGKSYNEVEFSAEGLGLSCHHRIERQAQFGQKCYWNAITQAHSSIFLQNVILLLKRVKVVGLFLNGKFSAGSQETSDWMCWVP